MKKILMGNRYIRRYCEDPIFNSRVILYRGLQINILYALFKLITMDTVIPNITTGTAVAVIVTVIAVYMLMTSRINLSDPMRDKG